VFKTYLIVQKHKNKVYYQSTTTLQAVFRAYLFQKEFKRLYSSSITLQAIIRTYQKEQELKVKQSAVSLCQTYINCANARTKHINTINAISRCQAVLRGTLLRTQQKKILHMQLGKIRKEIMELWQKTFTAFMYRAKFWIVYERPTYLNLAIHNEELDRLQNLLHRLSTSKIALNEAKMRFEAEKAELRRLLKEELQQNIRESLYTSWGINVKSKNKKDKLLNELFKTGNDSNPKQSATALLTICSSHSASILDVTSQVELRKADRIRDNLLLTVFSSLSSMQSLNRSLQKQQKYNRKQQLTVRTLNEELKHKQSVITNQRRKLSEFTKPDNLYKIETIKESKSSIYSPLKSRHSKTFSSLGNIPIKQAENGAVPVFGRRFSDIGTNTKQKTLSIVVRNYGSDDVEDEPLMLRNGGIAYNDNDHNDKNNGSEMLSPL